MKNNLYIKKSFRRKKKKNFVKNATDFSPPVPTPYHYIVVTDQTELEYHCQKIRSEIKNHQFNYIALDGEFYGYGASYPKLSLLQIAYCDIVIILDMMLDLDWSPLIEILESDNILKVLHSCKHDIIALYNHMKCKLLNIFDIQIAMLFLGYPKLVSYRYIVQKYCGVEIDKQYQNSNWKKRPLSEGQLTYAANDVYYLLRAYGMIENELGQSRHVIVLEESDSMALSCIKSYKKCRKIY